MVYTRGRRRVSRGTCSFRRSATLVIWVRDMLNPNCRLGLGRKPDSWIRISFLKKDEYPYYHQLLQQSVQLADSILFPTGNDGGGSPCLNRNSNLPRRLSLSSGGHENCGFLLYYGVANSHWVDIILAYLGSFACLWPWSHFLKTCVTCWEGCTVTSSILSTMAYLLVYQPWRYWCWFMSQQLRLLAAGLVFWVLGALELIFVYTWCRSLDNYRLWRPRTYRESLSSLGFSTQLTRQQIM